MLNSLISALILSAAPATAAPDELLSRVDATRLMAACVLKRDRKDAVAIASLMPATPAFDKAARRIEPALVTCLRPDMRSLSIRLNDLRGAFAETLLKEDNGAALARAGALPAVPPQRIGLSKSPAASDAALFACVAGAEPTQAVSLVQADPGSVEEGAAFRTLLPSLQRCAPEKAAMRLKPFQVRLLVAASLYGRLTASSGS